MRMSHRSQQLAALSAALLLGVSSSPAAQGPIGSTIGQVLREPLPLEKLTLVARRDVLRIEGPTFAYEVRRDSGRVSSFVVSAEGRERIRSVAPWVLQVDDYRLRNVQATGRVEVLQAGPGRIELKTEGVLRSSDPHSAELDYTLLHSFFNDGVVVCSVKLRPRKDLLVRSHILTQVRARGEFSHWLHKRRDENGSEAARGPLPAQGRVSWQKTLTSCLQVFSPTAGMAVFTDAGGSEPGEAIAETASAEVHSQTEAGSEVSLTQFIVRPSRRNRL